MMADRLSEHQERHLRITAVRRVFHIFHRAAQADDGEPYLEPALRRHIDPFVPPERRNFFSIASHYEPITLYAHFQHWFDHAWLVHAPNASPMSWVKNRIGRWKSVLKRWLTSDW